MGEAPLLVDHSQMASDVLSEPRTDAAPGRARLGAPDGPASVRASVREARSRPSPTPARCNTRNIL